jgi:hypothetical protein
MGPPPQLILPEHWEAKRPAIIRPGDDILRAERARLKEAGLPGIGGLLGGAPLPVKLTYITSVGFTANGNTLSGNFTLTEACDVLLIGVGDQASSYGTVSNVTIGGVSRTPLDGEHACAFGLGLSAGTISFSATWTTARSRGAIHILKVENLDTPAKVDGQNIFVSGLTSPFTLDVPDGGAAAVAVYKGGYSGDIVWTNATEVYDQLIESTSKHGCAFYENNGVGFEANKVITPAYSGSSGNAALGIAVSFR